MYLYYRLKERKLDTYIHTYIQYIVAVACPDKLHTIYITLHTVVKLASYKGMNSSSMTL